jgi:hypothetical protein
MADDEISNFKPSAFHSAILHYTQTAVRLDILKKLALFISV